MDFLSYRYYEDEKAYMFNIYYWYFPNRMYITMEEFDKLMINKFNAKRSSWVYDHRILFKEEKDIQLAINYIKPIIESYLLMETLTGNLKKGLI